MQIVLDIDRETLEKLKEMAKRRKLGLEEMLRRHLGEFASEEEQAARRRKAVDELLEMSRDSGLKVGKITWTRDDLHER
jgi:hypothetical protein